MTTSLFRYILLFGLSLCCVVPAVAVETATIRVALSEAMPPISYTRQGEANGMFREILEALFEVLPAYRAEFRAYPWARAQWLVQHDQMDLLLTFPSQDRKQYAEFSKQPVFTLDYGNLVYRADNSRSNQIIAANSFEDLRGLVFISQDMVAWEKENVPQFIQRYSVHNPSAIMHMAYERRTGDFFIMPAEQAIYYANMLGYRAQLAMRKVRFIPNSQVPFHLGVRKTLQGGSQLLSALEAAMQQPGFRAKRRAIEQKYRDLATAEPAPRTGSSPK